MLKASSRGYVIDENIEQVCRTNEKLLYQLDVVLSCLRQVEPTGERIIESGDFVAASMKTWHKLGISVTPKSNIFEDHTLEFMQALKVDLLGKTL